MTVDNQYNCAPTRSGENEEQFNSWVEELVGK